MNEKEVMHYRIADGECAVCSKDYGVEGLTTVLVSKFETKHIVDVCSNCLVMILIRAKHTVGVSAQVLRTDDNSNQPKAKNYYN